MTIFSAALLLFLVIDPFGNIPFFLTSLKNVEAHRKKRIVIRELFIALIALVLFLFTGQYILNLLQISEPSLTISGGIILFLIAIKMIFPTGKRFEQKIDGEPFIVPLAIPYVAGPSALASVLFIMSREPNRWPEWLIAVVAAWFVSGVIIFSASSLGRFLGERGLVAIERLMGMILTAIAVQMIMTGITQFMALDF